MQEGGLAADRPSSAPCAVADDGRPAFEEGAAALPLAAARFYTACLTEALAAIHRRACAMLSRAMERASRAGYGMPQVLGGRATAPHVMRELASMMIETDAREAGMRTRPIVLPESSIPRALMLRSLQTMPNCASLLLVRSCIEGVVQFAADSMFEAHEQQ